jgi:D-hydroxyproline dehydrogenase subunit beta
MSVAGRADVAIVGAGIVGLALAVVFAERGKKVAVFDREERPVGASIRNFGLVWPMGQPRGPLWQRALRSRARWLDLSRAAGFHVAENGSLHLAANELEAQVLREFLEQQAPSDFRGEFLKPDALARRSPAARAENLVGGLWSPHEMTVDGREALPALWRWLAAERGVTVLRDAAVSRIVPPAVHTAQGVWEVGQTFVCTGAELRLLYPEVFRAAGVTNCKLQMWRTAPQSGGWRLGASLCGGLTLLHYSAFAACPSLAALRTGFEGTHADYLANGIHVLVSQNSAGEVVLGDTHHYGLTHDPFLHERLDRLVRDYLLTFANVPEITASERWFGVYAKLPGSTEFIARPEPGVTIVNALGGNGMTLSFGLAEELADA